MKHALAEQLVMVAEMTIKPDRRDEFLDYTVANLRISRGYPGNIVFDILVNEAEPDRVVFHEVWDSVDAQQAYMAWRIGAGDLSTLMSFLAGEPKFTALRRIVD